MIESSPLELEENLKCMDHNRENTASPDWRKREVIGGNGLHAYTSIKMKIIIFVCTYVHKGI